MGKRDAFGNEISDDPLTEMGWGVGEDATAPTPISADAAPSVPTMPTMPSTPPAMSAGAPPAPTAPRLTPTMPAQLPTIPRRSGFSLADMIGRFIVLGISLAVLGGIGIAVYAAVDTARDVSNSFPKITTPQVNLPGITTPTPGDSTSKSSAQSKPAEPPSGLQPRSLVRAEAFAPTLVKIREQGTRAQTMRLDPTRVNANVLNNDNLLRVVSVSWEGNLQTTKTSSRLTGVSTVSLNNVSSKSPSRALARAAKLLGRPATSFNYMVLMNLGGQAQWLVYFKDGKYVRASVDGRSVQKVN